MEGSISDRIGRSADMKRLKFSAIGVFAFYLAANGFILFNYVPQHDGLSYVNKFITGWEYQLGRFLMPFYWELRGETTMPWLIGLLSMLFLTMVTYMVTEMFGFRRPLSILGCAAVLSANTAHLETLAAYIHIEDVCMAALLLACLSVYLTWQKLTLKRAAAAAVLLVISMGLYQTFIGTALTLTGLLCVRELLGGADSARRDRLRWLKMLIPPAAAAAAYFLINTLVLKITGLAEPADYHSLRSMLEDLPSLWPKICKAYDVHITYFFVRPDMTLWRIGNCLSAAAALILILRILRERKLSPRLWIPAGCLMALSTVTALMFNIGSGIVGHRMAFGLLFFPILFLALLEENIGEIRTQKVLRTAACCFLAVGIWHSISLCNGAYSMQKILYDRTVSLYTRVMDDIYEVDGYRHDQTPVILVGDYDFIDYTSNFTREYREILWYSFLNTSVTYRQTVGNLLRYLGEDIRLVDDEALIAAAEELPEVAEMPSFPDKGYCRMIGDYLVIRF